MGQGLEGRGRVRDRDRVYARVRQCRSRPWGRDGEGGGKG